MKELIKGRRLSYDLGEEVVAPRVESPPHSAAGRRVNPTLSAAAVAQAQEGRGAAYTAGDCRYQSVADLIRAALRAYGKGLRLTQRARSGRKKRHTVELPAELFEEYRKLPSRSRGVIVERALLSLLARGLEG